MEDKDFDVASAAASLLPRSAEQQVLKEFTVKVKADVDRLVDILKRNGYDPVTGKPPLGPWPPNFILKEGLGSIISIIDKHREHLPHASSRQKCGTCAFLADFDAVRKEQGIVPAGNVDHINEPSEPVDPVLHAIAQARRLIWDRKATWWLDKAVKEYENSPRSPDEPAAAKKEVCERKGDTEAELFDRINHAKKPDTAKEDEKQ